MPKPTISTSNAYGLKQADSVRLWTYVSPDDAQFFRRLIPLSIFTADAVLSTLFRALITELRTLETENGTRFEPAFFADHPTAIIVTAVIQRLADRIHPVREAGARDGQRGTAGAHKKHGNASGVGTKQKSGVGKGGNRSRGEKVKESSSVQP